MLPGFPAGTFPHAQPWNEPGDGSPEAEDAYCDPAQIRDSLNLSHQGCGYMVRLVVNGPRRGTLWEDGRCSDMGITPFAPNFATWYLRWLRKPGAKDGCVGVPLTTRIDQNDHHDRIDCSGRLMATPARDESLQDETYLPQENTAEIIDFLSALRDRGQEAAHPRPRLTGPDGHGVELPEPMFEVLLQVAAALKAGLAVTVAPHHLTLSTQEAADLLRISRTTLVRLLETGAIPFEKPSRHRKVRLDDLLEYRRRQRSQAELAFADMVADTERLGLYDSDPAEVKAALKAARRKTED
jgi:excisionase family DNA binding protein